MMEKPQEPEPKPDVIPGDEVFFKHPAGDMSGRVLCIGKHGVQIECGGKQKHRVKWDAVLAHKRRAAQHYDIAEHGEDGHLVQDEKGRKRFMAVPAESRADPWVVKALSATTKKQPKPGDRVAFKDKDMSSGEGVIVGRTGKDGAHVRDDNGKVHAVEWRHIKRARTAIVAS